MESELITVSLFPLPGAVLYPRTNRPLNIFEPRYVKMFNDALENGSYVALAFEDRKAPAFTSKPHDLYIRDIAGYGAPVLIERRSDETMVVYIKCIGRARVISVLEHTSEPYIQTIVKPLPDEVGLSDDNQYLLQHVRTQMKDYFLKSGAPHGDVSEFFKQLKTPEQNVNYACAFLAETPELQQNLLELNDINQRLELISLALTPEESQ